MLYLTGGKNRIGLISKQTMT